jgi:hypothetical protein
MQGLVKPCSINTKPANTGIDCQAAMGPTAMLIMVPASDKWQASDELTFLTYCITKMHAATGRWYPILGKNAPIRSIDDGKEADVLQTFDDGATAFVRSGMYARTFMSNKGGLAYGKALRSFNGLLDWAFIEVSRSGSNLNVLRMANSDGSFSGVPLNLAYAPTPKIANLKEVYENAFYINFSPDYYIGQGDIMTTSDDLLGSLTGLKDVEIYDAGTSTTTKLRIGVRTKGTQIDLAALYAGLAAVGNFIVTSSTGVVTTVASAALVAASGSTPAVIELTGTWTAGVWNVTGAAASVWKALTPSVAGYDAASGSVAITTT